MPDFSDAQQSFEGVIRRVEDELGVAGGFLTSLLREDDWAFIVKLHALVEAAISRQLASVLDERLADDFAALDISRKVAFAKSLDLLTGPERQFVNHLSQLRNDLVHDVRQTTFEIASHFRTLDKNQRRSFINANTHFASESSGWKELARADPRLAIWASGVSLLSKAVHDALRARLDRDIKQLTRESILELLAPQESETAP